MAIYNEIMVSKAHETLRIDGEYYLPGYVNNEAMLSILETKPLPVVFFVSDGNHMGISRHFIYEPLGVPYYRGQDINDFFLGNTKPIYIPQSIYEKPFMNRSHFKEGDILLSIVGTVGNLAIVTDRDIPATGSCKIAILRSKNKMNPFYLSAFLLSKYGQLQIKRNTRGAVQTGLILEDMHRIRIPVIGTESEEEIERLIIASIKENRNAKSLYARAKTLLDSELGLDKLIFEKPVGYEASFSEIVNNNRADAEFHQVKYKPFLKKITEYKNGWCPLSSMTLRLLPNFQAPKKDHQYEYLEISDVSIADGNYQTNRLLAKNIPANGKIRLSGGEIVISMVRPTRGAIAIIEDNLSHDTICSGAFYVCKAKEPNAREIIWLFLRCIRSVFGKYCGGTSYPTIGSHYLGGFPVPKFGDEVKNKIRELIVNSNQAKRESTQLLEQAKQRVEVLIEEAVKNEPVS